MSLRLYMDEHVRRAVVTALRLRGVDVVIAQSDSRGGAADTVLLTRAMELGRVLFTQDVDMLGEACRRQREGEPFAGLIYGHQLRVGVGVCIRDLELLCKASEPAELADRVVYLPL